MTENIKSIANKMLSMDWRNEDKYKIYDNILEYIEENDCTTTFTIDDLKENGFSDHEICEIMQVHYNCLDCSMT